MLLPSLRLQTLCARRYRRTGTTAAKRKYNRTNKLPSHFRRPVFNPAQMNLSENLERYWTEERCLEQRLLAELSITEELVKLPESNEMENCICFNYFENGILINIKYRSGRKHFKW